MLYSNEVNVIYSAKSGHGHGQGVYRSPLDRYLISGQIRYNYHNKKEAYLSPSGATLGRN